jgi:hypothetical protein
MPPPDERLMEDQDIAKSPRPGARAKSSAWAGCLGLSRATAIKPDSRYLSDSSDKVKKHRFC